MFKQHTGVSPDLFRNALRVEDFKQHTGVNPNQFKRVVAQVA